MDVGQRLDELYFGPHGLFAGVGACRSGACIHSALILIYTLVDISAFLDLPPDNRHSSGTTFVKWTNRYVQPQEMLGVSGDDLWIARCGIVHALSGGLDKASAKSKLDGVVDILYAYGSQPAIPSELLSLLEPPERRVMIHLDHLVEALRQGAHRFIESVVTDAAKTAAVAERLETVFANVPSATYLIP